MVLRLIAELKDVNGNEFEAYRQFEDAVQRAFPGQIRGIKAESVEVEASTGRLV